MGRGAVSPQGTSRRRLYRQSPGERWGFALILLPALMTAALVVTKGPDIEADLQQRALTSLDASGLAGVKVEMSGRNATLLVPTGQDLGKAKAAAQTVTGIGEVKVEPVARSAAEERACEGLKAALTELAANQGLGFSGSSAALTGSAPAEVGSIGRLMTKCPSASVIVDGHTDGSVLNASTVSLRRAEAVRDALVRAGVKPERVDANGYGDTLPIAEGDSPTARALNNRVEITLGEG